MILRIVNYCVDYFIPDRKQFLRSIRMAISKWARKMHWTLVRLIAYFVSGCIGYAFLLAFVKGVWFWARETPVGQEYLHSFSSTVMLKIISAIQKGPALLAVRTMVDMLVINLVIGFVGQVFCLRRYFFDGRGIIYKSVWYLGCTMLCSLNVLGSNVISSFSAGVVLYFMPACWMLEPCMAFVRLLTPEMSIFLKIKDLKAFYRIAKIRNSGNRVRKEMSSFSNK